VSHFIYDIAGHAVRLIQFILAENSLLQYRMVSKLLEAQMWLIVAGLGWV